MTCEGCAITLIEAIVLHQSRDKSVEMLTNHGVISAVVKCTECGELATLNNDNLTWRCQRRRTERKGKKVFHKKCNFKQSVKTYTWFENAHLTPEKCCMFVALYLLIDPPREEYLMRELKIQSHTEVDWSSFVREVLEDDCFHNSSQQLGGPGITVEIDEAKFGKRKYNRGRIVDGVWIFGGFERGSKNVFIEAVSDRTSATLLEVIRRRILPGTTIISDCWRAYNCLKDEGELLDKL